MLFRGESLLSFLSKRGSAIAKIIGNNLKRLTNAGRPFEVEANMWVFEEIIDGRKLTEIINQDHENVK